MTTQEQLGPRWFDIGDGRWQHEETGRIVGLSTEAPNWREACEIEYAARLDAEAQLTASQAEVGRLKDALSLFADPESWWIADAVNVHGFPVKVKAWKFGSEPWTEAARALLTPPAAPEADTSGEV